MNRRFQTEEYEVKPPEPPSAFDLLASGVKIAEVVTTSDSIFVQGFTQQRFFPKDLIVGVEQYAQRINRRVEWVIFDNEYHRFEFHTLPLGDKDDRTFPVRSND